MWRMTESAVLGGMMRVRWLLRRGGRCRRRWLRRRQGHGHVVEVVAEGHDAVGSGDAFEIEEALGFGYAGGDTSSRASRGCRCRDTSVRRRVWPARMAWHVVSMLSGEPMAKKSTVPFSEAWRGPGVWRWKVLRSVEGAVGDEAVFDWGEEGSVVVDDDGVGAARAGL